MTTWFILPKDMVSEVLSKLPLMDRLNARLVCTFWSHVIDTDSRIWRDITYLHSLHSSLERHQPYKYRGCLITQVRDYQLIGALTFLASRKAPIRALEFSQEPGRHLFYMLLNLTKLLPELGISLVFFCFRSDRWCTGLFGRETGALVSLIKSQPSLERVHLEVGPTGLPPPGLSSLPRLSILSLLVSEQDQLDAFQDQAPLLGRLTGLRLILRWNLYNEESDPAVIANVSDTIQHLAHNLRRVETVTWPFGSENSSSSNIRSHQYNEFVWGTEDLAPYTAASLILPFQYQRRKLKPERNVPRIYTFTG